MADPKGTPTRFDTTIASGRSPSPSQGSQPQTGRVSPISPRNSRSYGADAYSVDYVKKQSLAVNTEVKDPCTACVGTIAECDARCSLPTQSGNVWLGQRDGSITVHKADGELIHIIERRKGAFVWCLLEVGKTVWAGCSDGFIRVLSQNTYQMEAQFARHAGGGGGVYTLAYHPASNTVFSGSNDFQILAWEASTRSFLQQMSGHSAAIRCLLIDPMALTLHSGADDGNIFVWDLHSLQKKADWRGHTKGVHSLARTKDHIWSGSEDATIRIWDPATGECVGWAEVHTGTVNSLTPVGDKVFSGAGDTVCVWDADKLSLLGTYVVHNGYLSTICVTAMNTIYRLWSTASDATVKLWTVECQTQPDETDALKEKLETLGMAQHEANSLKETNRHLLELGNSLREQIAQNGLQMQEVKAGYERQLTELAAKLRLAEGDEIGRRALQDENNQLRALHDESKRLLNSVNEQNAADANAVKALQEEAVRLRPLQEENLRLIEELKRRDLSIADLGARNKDLVTRMTAAAAGGVPPAAVLPHVVDPLAAGREAALLEELGNMRNDNAALREQMNNTIRNYEAKVATINAQLEAQRAAAGTTGLGPVPVVPPVLAPHGGDDMLRNEIEKLQAALKAVHEEKYDLHSQLVVAKNDAERLTDENQRMQLDGSSMANKLRDMDIMFKSRLSLLTDIFRVFKKLEAAEKKCKAGTNIRSDLNSLIATYRNTIASHYTDGELIHLGSSRHFFPTTSSTSQVVSSSPGAAPTTTTTDARQHAPSTTPPPLQPTTILGTPTGIPPTSAVAGLAMPPNNLPPAHLQPILGGVDGMGLVGSPSASALRAATPPRLPPSPAPRRTSPAP